MNNDLKPSRYPSRSTMDSEQINAFLDEVPYCTLSYIKEENPLQLPIAFVRVGNSLMIHGSIKSQFLKDLLDAKMVSFSATMLDGLVLAKTAFDHSMNYRSVFSLGTFEEVADPDKKRDVLMAFTEKYIPGRSAELPPVLEEELEVTQMLAMPITRASLKSRSGGSGSYSDEIWTGTVPAHLTYGMPIPDDRKNSRAVPAYLTELVVKSNAF